MRAGGGDHKQGGVGGASSRPFLAISSMQKAFHCSRLVSVVLDLGGDGMSKRSRIPPKLAVSPKYTAGFLSFGLPRL